MMLKQSGEVIVLPAGYTRVTAVGSKYTSSPAHTCQVDTGFVPTDSTKIYIVYRYVGAKSNANQIIGCSNTTQGTGGLIVFLDALRWNSGGIGAWGTPTAGETYEVTAWNDGSLIHYLKNGVEKTGTPGGVCSTTQSLYLLGRNQGGSMYANSPACMVYRMKIWENGVLARDFIPCVRDNDSRAGFYDIANSQFYTKMSSAGNLLDYEA